MHTNIRIFTTQYIVDIIYSIHLNIDSLAVEWKGVKPLPTYARLHAKDKLSTKKNGSLNSNRPWIKHQHSRRVWLTHIALHHTVKKKNNTNVHL